MERKLRFGLIAAWFSLSVALVVIVLTNSAGSSGEGSGESGAPLNQAGFIAETGEDPELMSRYIGQVGIVPVFVGDFINQDFHEHRPGMTFGAESDFEVLEHVASDLALAQANIARAYHDRNQLDEGLPWVEEALRLDPELPQAHLVSGFLNFRLRNANEAIRDFKKVLELDPTEFDAYLYLGLIYNGRENANQSLRYLNRAVDLADSVEERSIALTYRAIAYSMLWRYEEAFEDLRFAEILDPDNGWITIARSSINQAITIRQDLIPEDPYVEEEGGSRQKLDFGN